MTTAERLINQGRKEGRMEGRKEGRKEGLDEGEKNGLEKGLIKAALNMFRRGMDLNTVQACIELPLEQLQLLQRQVSHS